MVWIMGARNDAALRRALSPLPAASPVPPHGWRTGIEALDEILPAGVPRGHVTEWAGAQTSGKVAALASLASGVLGQGGEGVAYVHSAGSLDPRSWSWAGAFAAPFWVVRVSTPRESWQALDVVLRMGAFGLVVSEGVPPPNVALRLQRLARSSDAAWVALVGRTGVVTGAAVRVRFELKETAWPACRVAVRVVQKGLTRRAEFPCEIVLPYRLCDDSGLPDRRTRAGRGRRA